MKKILGFLSILLLASCGSSVSVSYDYDKEADFSQYETFEYYGWAEESDKILNEFDKRRIEEAVGGQLADRGLEYVESGGDLVVSLFIVVDEKTGVSAYTDHYSMGSPYGTFRYGPGWGWGYGHSVTRYHEYDYLQGTLVIDVFDREEKKLVWQGIGTGTVDDNPQTREKNINKAVAKIMAYFPIKPVDD